MFPESGGYSMSQRSTLTVCRQTAELTQTKAPEIGFAEITSGRVP